MTEEVLDATSSSLQSEFSVMDGLEILFPVSFSWLDLAFSTELAESISQC
jgi:hypothetical protein